MLASRWWRWGWTGLVVAVVGRGSTEATSTEGSRRSMAGGRMWGGRGRARV